MSVGNSSRVFNHEAHRAEEPSLNPENGTWPTGGSLEDRQVFEGEGVPFEGALVG